MLLLRRLQAWRRRGGGGGEPRRWIVLDVESSGLDPKRDRLIAIAAVALQLGDSAPRLCPGDSFEAVLQQPQAPDAPDKANILLHGIGVQAQRQGLAAQAALQGFADYVRDAPLLAFHAAFDRALIERGLRELLGLRLHNPWLDIEPLAAVLHPQVKARALDEWLAHFGISCVVRHQAAADAWATAELLQRLWPALRAQIPKPCFADLSSLAAHRRWLPHG